MKTYLSETRMSSEEQERKRLQEIDSIAPAIKNKELIHEAKFGDPQRGISPYSAAELSIKDAQKRAKDIIYADVDVAVQAVKSGTTVLGG